MSYDRRMRIRSSIGVAAVVALFGCKSKADKQAEIAETDVSHLVKIVGDRHVDSLPRALPEAASKLTPPLDRAGETFNTLRDKTDDLRSSKRSFFAIVDSTGQIVWVDEPAWPVKGRIVDAGFPPVKDALAGKGSFFRGSGRFGGDPEGALIFMDASPIKGADGKVEGALVAAWEAIDAAEDLQGQLLTEHGMQSATPNVHNKVKEQHKKAMEEPDTWIALFRGPTLYFVGDAYQPLEDASKALDIAGKTASGNWKGTFDVANTTWGGAAARISGLGPDVGIVVFRHQN